MELYKKRCVKCKREILVKNKDDNLCRECYEEKIEKLKKEKNIWEE